MTRRDFELIAETLKAARTNADPSHRDVFIDLALDFAERLKATNAQFNRDRFLRACGATP